MPPGRHARRHTHSSALPAVRAAGMSVPRANHAVLLPPRLSQGVGDGERSTYDAKRGGTTDCDIAKSEAKAGVHRRSRSGGDIRELTVETNQKKGDSEGTSSGAGSAWCGLLSLPLSVTLPSLDIPQLGLSRSASGTPTLQDSEPTSDDPNAGDNGTRRCDGDELDDNATVDTLASFHTLATNNTYNTAATVETFKTCLTNHAAIAMESALPVQRVCSKEREAQLSNSKASTQTSSSASSPKSLPEKLAVRHELSASAFTDAPPQIATHAAANSRGTFSSVRCGVSLASGFPVLVRAYYQFRFCPGLAMKIQSRNTRALTTRNKFVNDLAGPSTDQDIATTSRRAILPLPEIRTRQGTLGRDVEAVASPNSHLSPI